MKKSQKVVVLVDSITVLIVNAFSLEVTLFEHNEVFRHVLRISDLPVGGHVFSLRETEVAAVEKV